MKKLILFSLLISFNSYANITYTPDGSGGYYGSDGTNWTTDSYGNLNGSDGTNCNQNSFGTINCYGGSLDNGGNSQQGWDNITKGMGQAGTNLGKALGGIFSNSKQTITNSGTNSQKKAQLAEAIRQAQEASSTRKANSFKPPVQFSGKWKKVTSSSDGSTYYIDENTLMRGKDSVFYWALDDYSKSDTFGDRSKATYNQADCNLMAYKRLTLNTYKQSMARQLTSQIEHLPDKEWNYTEPKYVKYIMVKKACGKNIIPVEEEEEEEIWLTCKGDITINLTIYPETKEFRLYKGKKKYTEAGDFINFIDYIDHPDEKYNKKNYFKYENKLNRITGKFTQLDFRKTGTIDYDPDTKTFVSNYEPGNNWEYQCSKEDTLF